MAIVGRKIKWSGLRPYAEGGAAASERPPGRLLRGVPPPVRHGTRMRGRRPDRRKKNARAGKIPAWAVKFPACAAGAGSVPFRFQFRPGGFGGLTLGRLGNHEFQQVQPDAPFRVLLF